MDFIMCHGGQSLASKAMCDTFINLLIFTSSWGSDCYCTVRNQGILHLRHRIWYFVWGVSRNVVSMAYCRRSSWLSRGDYSPQVHFRHHQRRIVIDLRLMHFKIAWIISCIPAVSIQFQCLFATYASSSVCPWSIFSTASGGGSFLCYIYLHQCIVYIHLRVHLNLSMLPCALRFLHQKSYFFVH